jgi:hypothetical protein
MFFGCLWNPSIFDGINQMKDKKRRYIIFIYAGLSFEAGCHRNSASTLYSAAGYF